MKKKLSMLLVPAIALTLTACGSSGGQASGTPAPSPTSTVSTTASPTSDTTAEEVVFNTTVDEVISVLATNVENTVSVSPLDVIPDVEPQEPMGRLVAGNSYGYTIYDGVSLIIVDSSQSKKVQSILVFADTDKLTNDTAYDLGCYQATLVAMFEPNEATLEKVDTELNIANSSFSEDNIYFSTGTIAEYTYTITDGIAMLSIDPK